MTFTNSTLAGNASGANTSGAGPLTRRTLFILVLLLAGCTDLAPQYERPSDTVPESWPALLNNDTRAMVDPDAIQAASVISWCNFFLDERLLNIIQLALSQNRDLRIAALNVAQAHARYRIQDAALYPVATASANATQQFSQRAVPGANEGAVWTAGGNNYSVSFGLTSYELDFFGKMKNLNRAALQTFLSTVEAKRYAQISLVAEVAVAWLLLGADREQIRLAALNIESLQTTLDLRRKEHDVGAIAGPALIQTQIAIDTARAEMAKAEVEFEQDRNALILLVGFHIPEELMPMEMPDHVSAMVDVPAGLPSLVLHARPDVLASERTLMAANAEVGVARAAFFPSIAMTATGGASSNQLSGLVEAIGAGWSFSPSISIPIFDHGSRTASLEVSQTRRDVALAQYEKVVQAAFMEVANALALHSSLTRRMDIQQSLVVESARSLGMTQALFRAGSVGYQEVLTAQRSLYTAQQSAIALHLLEMGSRITLYKVLGGGAMKANCT